VKAVAFRLLNRTAVAAVKLAPRITTVVPATPVVGVKLPIVGANVTTKLIELASSPAGVVRLMRPVVAPAGTVAVICVGELTLKTAMRPLKRTSVAPVKLAPMIVTVPPTALPVGTKLVMAGAAETVKLAVLAAVPLAVVTLIGPVAAPVGTVAAS